MATGSSYLRQTPSFLGNASLGGTYFFFGKCQGSALKASGSLKYFPHWVSTNYSTPNHFFKMLPSTSVNVKSKPQRTSFKCFGINVLWDREKRWSEMSLKIGLSSSFLVELTLIFNTPSVIRRKERSLVLSTDLFWAHIFPCSCYIFSSMIHEHICIIFLALWESGRVTFGPHLEQKQQNASPVTPQQ